jgi:CSLREA domain-containing protein
MDQAQTAGLHLQMSSVTRASTYARRRRVVYLVILAAGVLLGAWPSQPAHAATLTVDTNADDTTDNLNCTLREAIEAANTNATVDLCVHTGLAGTDTITFNIPGDGPHTIAPTSALPTITAPVIINGYTEPGSAEASNPAATLMIELDGTSAGGGADGLVISTSNSTVQGLVINRFPGNGIQLANGSGNLIRGNHIGTDVAGTVDLGNGNSGVFIANTSNTNTIGGTTVGDRNVISGNGLSGIRMSGSSLSGGASFNTVLGNFIGVNSMGAGTVVGNGEGGVTMLSSMGNTIGSPEAGNVISANNFGVLVTGGIFAGGNSNTIRGNHIGTDVDGMADLGNAFNGVRIINVSTSNTVGGTAEGAGNVISGNNGDGIFFGGGLNCCQTVQGNLIGTASDGATALGNLGNGVWISSGTSSNTIGGSSAGASNVIAFNAGDGVNVNGVTANSIRRNSIHSNGGLGIDLEPNGVTPNDAGDGDTGSNDLQNFPVLESAAVGSTTVEGSLNSTPNQTFTLDLFSNPNCDSSGHGEGRTYLGSDDVTTDGSGNAAFTISVFPSAPIGSDVTATATRGGNTSEFSNCVEAEAGGPKLVNSTGDAVDADTNDPACDTGIDLEIEGVSVPECTLRAAIQQTNAISGPDDIYFKIPGAGPHTIQPTSGLPAVTGPLTIDGYTEPGATKATESATANPMIRLNGESAGNGQKGLTITGGGTTVRGLIIFRWNEVGILLTGGDGNTITGNYIGTNPEDAGDFGNGEHGVWINAGSSNNVIGGSTPADRNIISNNGFHGVRITNSDSGGNSVQGNYIGTDDEGDLPSAFPLGNGANGVSISFSPGNTIGGIDEGEGNLIADNGGRGVAVEGDPVGNSIRGNSIHLNGNLGIDLAANGVTTNDTDDPDTGPNNLQNFPVVTSVTKGSSTVVEGTLNSTPSTTFHLDFYSSSACDASGNGEGRKYLGSLQVTTNSDGDASFDDTVPGDAPAAHVVTATATDPNGNTSEFSACGGMTGGRLIVNSTGDAGDANTGAPACATGAMVGPDPECTLRAAIQQANTTTGADEIHFEIPGPGPHTISPGSALPNISDDVVIDGYTEPGAVPASNPSAVLKIVLNGSGAGGSNDGLNITASGGPSTVRGLVIRNFPGDGIDLDNSNANTIRGNYIGTDVTGESDMGNGSAGIRVTFGSNNVVGGTDVADRNVISGNITGVAISSSDNSTIQGNYIGTDDDGFQSMGSTVGIAVVAGSTNNEIGGTLEGAGNVISGNAGIAVQISTGTSSTSVQGNRIGTSSNGAGPIPNGFGVNIQDASNNVIGGTTAGAGNTIAFSQSSPGVNIINVVGSSTNNQVRGNSIFSNAGLGIDLGPPSGVNDNDVSDVDSGPNNKQNFPVLDDVSTGNSTTVEGTLNSTPGETFDLDFYSSPSCDSSDHGEGKTFLGSTSVTTDGPDDANPGDASFSETFDDTLGPYDQVTATATDANGNTSEFSECFGPETLVVNSIGNTADNTPGDGSCHTVGTTIIDGVPECTLRAAIQEANSATVVDAIIFNIPGAGPHTITPTSTTNLPEITQPVTIDAYTEPGAVEASNPSATLKITLDGVIAGSPSVDGLRISAGNTTIRGLVIKRFSGDGIEMFTNDGNTIQGNYIGTDITGEFPQSNSNKGIVVNDIADVTIGGTNVADRNIISGNAQDGVLVTGSTATDNVVQGNYIGTDDDGAQAIPNASSNSNAFNGVSIVGGPDNTVGGGEEGARNVISSNSGNGVAIVSEGASGNVVSGNVIGLNAAGTSPLGNGKHGVSILGADNNTIGGEAEIQTASVAAEPSNIISGNGLNGVNIAGDSSGNPVVGNYIGTDFTGQFDRGNLQDGVEILDSTGNTIGGPNAGDGNLISGNNSDGISIGDNALSLPDGDLSNVIQGNHIGTKLDGESQLANGSRGVFVWSAGNFIGKDGVGNLISGNGTGVRVDGGGTGNSIQSNHIGTDVDGMQPVPNSGAGVVVDGSLGTSTVTLGGNGDGEGNVISGNGGAGVRLVGSGATGNDVQGNLIGLKTDGDTGLANSGDGVAISDAPNNYVGGVTEDAVNVISANSGDGIEISGSSATGNEIEGNLIGTNSEGDNRGNGDYGVVVDGASDNSIGEVEEITTLEAGPGGNTIAFNSDGGVVVKTENGNAITGNSIYSNGGLGIDLGDDGVTSNDGPGTDTPPDADTGANNLQNFPELTAASSGSTTVQGTFESAPNTTFTLEFFANSQCDDSGNGQGEDFLGSAEVTTDVNGDATVDVTLDATAAAGNAITATATDPDGNTSEFSGCTDPVAVVVNSTGDAVDDGVGDGFCDTGSDLPASTVAECTLRAAIQETNSLTSNDTIKFNIPGAGPHAITPTTDLPALTDTVKIDGYSEPGAAKATNPPATLNIELSGGIESGDGLAIEADGTTITGLVIENFGAKGIEIESDDNVIVGNHIVGNGEQGVNVQETSGNRIGGTVVGDRNVISGNGSDGVRIAGIGSDNSVLGNFIGTDTAGTSATSNGESGVEIDYASGSTIGGTESGEGNVIAHNTGDGVTVTGDVLSTDQDDGNVIQGNSIHSNGGLGIDLGDDAVTANDPAGLESDADDDVGPNELQNFPILLTATRGSTNIDGNLTSTPETSFDLHFYANVACDALLNGEGQDYVGSFEDVLTNATGNAVFDVTFTENVPAGQFITATATDPDGNTSEFSNCVAVQALRQGGGGGGGGGPLPTPTPSATPSASTSTSPSPTASTSPTPQTSPSPTSTVVECADGIDNDGDGLSDGQDAGCLSSTDNSEGGPSPQCGNAGVICGDSGANHLIGTSGDDVIIGGGGNDTCVGGGGNDTIICGGGNDIIYGGVGDDVLKSTTGRDRIFGGKGNDTLRGGGGPDFLSGDRGADTLFGQRGADSLNGGPGSDNCRPGSGRDNVKAC